MLDQLFMAHCWAGAACFAVLYCTDYLLTLACARMYRSGANRHLVFKSFELTPFYQRDIASLRPVSPRFLFVLAIVASMIVAVWFVAAAENQELPWLWNAYRVLLGALLLAELAIHVRHFGNLVLFAYARHSQGISGRIRYAQWLVYKVSAIQLLGFAAIFAFLFALTDNWFFVGGTVKCLVEALKHWRLAAKHFANLDDPGSDEEVVDAELV
jgi:hypothetical protein